MSIGTKGYPHAPTSISSRGFTTLAHPAGVQGHAADLSPQLKSGSGNIDKRSAICRGTALFDMSNAPENGSSIKANNSAILLHEIFKAMFWPFDIAEFDISGIDCISWMTQHREFIFWTQSFIIIFDEQGGSQQEQTIATWSGCPASGANQRPQNPGKVLKTSICSTEVEVAQATW